MIEKTTIESVLAHFFGNPTSPIHLRALSRETGFTMPTIVSAVKRLEKEKLILVERGKAWTMAKANIESEQFRRLKRVHNLEEVYSSGFVDWLSGNCGNPKAIVCFGSYSRGDDIETSDIDIAVIGGKVPEKPLDTYEKRLKRKISLHSVALEKASKEFKSSLANGIVLEGAL